MTPAAEPIGSSSPEVQGIQDSIKQGFQNENETLSKLHKDLDDLRNRVGNMETFFRTYLERAEKDRHDVQNQQIALAAETKASLEQINQRITTLVSLRNLFFSSIVVCSVGATASLVVGIYSFFHG